MATKIVLDRVHKHISVFQRTFLKKCLLEKIVLFQGVQDGYSRWNDFSGASGTLYLCLMAVVGVIGCSSVIIVAFQRS